MNRFQLTEEQKKLLSKKLDHLRQASCQICGKKEWIASANIFELREFQGGNLKIGGKSAILPLIPVTCKHCGQTIFFNAISLGIINQQKTNG